MEELKQFKERLDGESEADEVLKILDELQYVSVTLETLKVTQLGLVVGNLKKKFPSNKKIIDQSRKLVADWKAACIPAATPEKTQNGKTPTKKEPEDKKETKKEESPAVDKKRKLSNTEEKAKKKPTPTPPKAVGEPGSDRDKARVLIAEALSATNPDAPDDEGDKWDPNDCAATVESELMTIFGSANKDYKAKLRSLLFNFKNNPVLRTDVLSGTIPVDKLCRMTAAEMASEKIQNERKQAEKWHMEAATIGKMEASTDQFLCGKCKNRKCTYYQLQTRSADEPMTTFVTCTVCNNRWKFC